MQKITAFLLQHRTILVVYMLAAIVAAVQGIMLGTHPFVMPKTGTFPVDIMNKPELMNQFYGKQLTEYNNYVIFKHSWFHLLSGDNLYGLYPDLHWDFYKYSPTFAFFMGVMAYFPDVVGLSIWDILNAITVFLAIRMLPFTQRKQSLLLWFVAMELLTCLQNSQSNGLMCGLMIAAYASLQRGKALWATLWIVLAAYIKVYSIICCGLFLFYPGFFRSVFYTIMWTVVLAALPLLVTPFGTLAWQYHNWVDLMKADAVAATGMSVAGWLHTWFGIDNVKGVVSIAGVLLFLLPFVRFGMWRNNAYRILMLASMLVWVVIFNHKAESPTFIIAVAGAGIWYYARPRAAWRTALLIAVLLFTSFSTTDLFPPYVRTNFIYPFTIKAVPCIIAWFVILAELMLMKKEDDTIRGSVSPAFA